VVGSYVPIGAVPFHRGQTIEFATDRVDCTRIHGQTVTGNPNVTAHSISGDKK